MTWYRIQTRQFTDVRKCVIWQAWSAYTAMTRTVDCLQVRGFVAVIVKSRSSSTFSHLECFTFHVYHHLFAVFRSSSAWPIGRMTIFQTKWQLDSLYHQYT